MMAAAIDFSLVLVAAGAFALAAYVWMGGFALPGNPVYWFAGLSALLGFIYKAGWALAGVDSPGLRGCHLRLVNFDGMEPSRAERFRRLSWSLLSLLAGGLGLVWSLVDEETLSWHDHSSKTFLTSFSTGSAAAAKR
jgi:uncharacterized RDD family membrane protein YckC